MSTLSVKEAGKKGGESGKGASKRRSPDHYERMRRISAEIRAKKKAERLLKKELARAQALG